LLNKGEECAELSLDIYERLVGSHQTNGEKINPCQKYKLCIATFKKEKILL
jgi:hypothetical protein